MDSRLERLQEWIKPEVRGLRPYEAEPSGPRIRLDANESAFDFPEELKREIWETFAQAAWNRYPDSECRELRKALAEREGVSAHQVLLGNGSDEIIRDLLVCFGGPGTRTVFPTPTFSMYRLLTIALGGTPVGVPLQADWSLDAPALQQEMAAETTRILFLSSPNNPTGNSFSAETMLDLLQGTDRLVVVDEAYRMFSGGSLVARLGDFTNLAILGTFSKAFSLAGLRVGYVVAHPEVIQTLNRVRLPYNLHAFAQAAARVALRNPDLWQAQAEQIMAERERVARALSGYPGVTVFPSQANFILVRVSGALDLRNKLAGQDIAVRGFPANEGLSDCLRITIGLPQENDALLAACRQALGR